MKRSIPSILILAVILSFMASCSGGGSSSSGSVIIEPKSYNFGSLDFGLTANYQFLVTNKSSDNINIIQRTISNPNYDFQVISGGQVGQAIYAGATHNVRIQFISKTPNGKKVCEIKFTWQNSTGKTGTFKVSLTGNAVPMPRFNISPTSKDFGKIKNNTTVTQDFIVTNTGSGNLNVQSPMISGPDAGLFQITAGSTGYTALPPASSFTITVSFTPLTDGIKNATMSISHDGTNVTSPSSVTLEGEGVTSGLTVTPTIWDFEQSPVGVSKSKDFEVENTGAINVRITRINYTGTYSGDFREVTHLPMTLVPGQKSKITINFTPTRVGARGLVNAEVINDSGLPENLTLDGEGANVGVLINEIHRAGANGAEYVELYNPTADPADISGWDLRIYNLTRTAPGHICGTYTFPAATILQAGEGLVVYDSFSFPNGTATRAFDAGFDITWGRTSKAEVTLFFGPESDDYGVDFFTIDQTVPPTNIPSNLSWTGKFPTSSVNAKYNIYRETASDTDNQSDFKQRDASADEGEKNPAQ